MMSALETELLAMAHQDDLLATVPRCDRAGASGRPPPTRMAARVVVGQWLITAGTRLIGLPSLPSPTPGVLVRHR